MATKLKLRHRRHAFAQAIGGLGKAPRSEALLVQRIHQRRVFRPFGRIVQMGLPL